MSYQKMIGTYPSADGVTEIHYAIYLPEGNPTAIVQISHGMRDYIERYEQCGFVEAMTGAGFVVCGNDHIGHGESAATADDLGYFEDYHHLSDDLHALNGILRRRYPSLPYVLFGHSMGSFLAREYITRYTDIDGVVLCGTSAGGQAYGLGKVLASLIGKLRGKRYRSRFLVSLSMDSYNKPFASEKEPYSFISSDPAVRARYTADPKCTFLFTAAAWRELYRLLAEVTSEEWAGKVPLSLPVYLIAGDRDPIAAEGEGTRQVCAALEECELNELKMKLYSGARHEVMNDHCREEVFADLVLWINEVAEGVIACRSYNSIPFGKVDFT